jgi:hypothetical protein
MNFRQLDKFLDARRFPADFWACMEAADRAYAQRDPRLIEWPTGSLL